MCIEKEIDAIEDALAGIPEREDNITDEVEETSDEREDEFSVTSRVEAAQGQYNSLWVNFVYLASHLSSIRIIYLQRQH